MNCGISVTWLGSIIVASRTANQRSRPRKEIRAKLARQRAGACDVGDPKRAGEEADLDHRLAYYAVSTHAPRR